MRGGFTLIELLVVMLLIGVLLALVLVGVQASRGAASRLACSNNLAEVGRGLAMHEASYGIFPPRQPPLGSSRGDSCSAEGIGWQVYILPFVGQGPLFDKIRRDYEANPDPYPDPANPRSAEHAANARVIVPLYSCPQDGRLREVHTDPDGITAGYISYLGVTGYATDSRSGLFGRELGASAAQIGDGLSNTLAVGERPPPDTYQVGWWYTTHYCSQYQYSSDFEGNIDGGTGANGCRGVPITFPKDGFPIDQYFQPGQTADPCDRCHYWSLHPGGGNFLFADGSVRFFPYSAAMSLRRLATINDRD